MSISFDGDVAIITGAGNGLGRAYALELSRRGARVVVNDCGGAIDGTGFSRAAADEVVDEIRAAGGEAVASHSSVATPAGGQAVIDTAVEAFGTVDIVVSNAGILRDSSFANLRSDDVDAVLDVHLRGAFHVAQPAFRIMKERGYGRLIFASSSAGLFGNFGQASYAAAKAGLIGLSGVLAIEGAKYGIMSNAVAPVAATRMTAQLLGEAAAGAGPETVVPLVILLASRECPVTHGVYSAAGGRFARAFVGVTAGWKAPNSHRALAAEDLLEHWQQIESRSGYSVPMSADEEFRPLLAARDATVGGNARAAMTGTSAASTASASTAHRPGPERNREKVLHTQPRFCLDEGHSSGHDRVPMD